jgi:hypothetical protein
MKKLLALPVVLLAMGQSAQAADVIPYFTDLAGLQNNTTDYTFDQSGLSGTFAQSGTSWTLNLTGNGNSAFYAPNGAGTGINTVYTVPSSAYTLNATWDAATKAFQGGFITIDGTPSAQVPGVSASSNFQHLYHGTLNSVSVSSNQAAIGFSVSFNNDAWTSQVGFTGGGGDAAYLFTPGGVASGVGPLSSLINELQTGQFTNLNIKNVESLAAVPLPLPAVLFGTGLTALMGIARKRKNLG